MRIPTLVELVLGILAAAVLSEAAALRTAYRDVIPGDSRADTPSKLNSDAAMQRPPISPGGAMQRPPVTPEPAMTRPGKPEDPKLRKPPKKPKNDGEGDDVSFAIDAQSTGS